MLSAGDKVFSTDIRSHLSFIDLIIPGPESPRQEIRLFPIPLSRDKCFDEGKSNSENFAAMFAECRIPLDRLTTVPAEFRARSINRILW